MLRLDPYSPDPEYGMGMRPSHYPASLLPCYQDPSIPYTAVLLSPCPILRLSSCPTLQPSCHPTIQLTHYELPRYSTLPLTSYLTIKLSREPLIPPCYTRNQTPWILKVVSESHQPLYPATLLSGSYHPLYCCPMPLSHSTTIPLSHSPTILLSHYPAISLLNYPGNPFTRNATPRTQLPGS